MKDYPLDRWLRIAAWPMDTACRVRPKLLKAVLVLLFPVWWVCLMPVTVVFLLVSVPIAVWDAVNGRS